MKCWMMISPWTSDLSVFDVEGEGEGDDGLGTGMGMVRSAWVGVSVSVEAIGRPVYVFGDRVGVEVKK